MNTVESQIVTNLNELSKYYTQASKILAIVATRFGSGQATKGELMQLKVQFHVIDQCIEDLRLSTIKLIDDSPTPPTEDVL